MIRRLRALLPFVMLASLAGCYEMNVKEVSSRLEIGMSRVELESSLKGQRFLKEQTALPYPGSTETQTRASVWNNRHYEFLNPEDLITKRLSFDGTIKVYSYLIKEKKKFAVPVTIDYLAVFYNQKEDKVIGWAHVRSMGEVRTWGDKF